MCAAHAPSLGVGMLADAEVRCLPLVTGEIAFGVRGASDSASPRVVRAEMASHARLYTRFVQVAESFDETIWDLGIGRTLAVAALGPGAIESEIWTETEASSAGLWVSVEVVPACPSAADDLGDIDRVGLAVIGDVDTASAVIRSSTGVQLVPSGEVNADLAICTDCQLLAGCLSATDGYYELGADVTYHVELRRADSTLPSATATLGVLR